MKYAAWFTLILLLFAGAYWYKCILGIDLFPVHGLSQYLPEPIRKLVRPDRIFKDETGVLFQDNFGRSDSLKHWVEIPLKKAGEFSYSLGVNCLYHTSCLEVVNRSHGAWSLQEHQLIEVTEGDRIDFDGGVQLNSISPPSGLGMILFDKHFHVLTVYYAVPDRSLGDLWEHVALKFRVPKGVSFLRFILNGWGPEAVSFENVEFSREKI